MGTMVVEVEVVRSSADGGVFVLGGWCSSDMIVPSEDDGGVTSSVNMDFLSLASRNITVISSFSLTASLSACSLAMRS